jgi:hypothetical protein
VDAAVRPRDVEATLAFARRGVDASALARDIKSLSALEDHVVAIADARAREGQFSLERNGFTLVRHTSGVTDFYDDDVVRTRYVAELEALVSKVTGAAAVVVYDVVLRGSKAHGEAAPGTRIYEHAFKAHVDGSGEGFLKNARARKPEVAARYEGCRFAEYNVWRPTAPVEEKPLALCDAATVSPGDLVAAFFDGWDQYPPEKRPNPLPQSGSYFHLAFDPAQRWIYFPDMTPDEVLVFRQWDSARTSALITPHTAFENPTTGPGANPRLSIEARTVAFFDEPQDGRGAAATTG